MPDWKGPYVWGSHELVTDTNGDLYVAGNLLPYFSGFVKVDGMTGKEIWKVDSNGTVNAIQRAGFHGVCLYRW